MPFSFSTGSLSSMKRQILVAWTPEHKESWQKDTWEKPLSTNKCHECFGSDFSEKSFPEKTSSLTATALSDRIIAQVKMCRKRVYRRHGGHQEGGEGAALSTPPARQASSPAATPAGSTWSSARLEHTSENKYFVTWELGKAEHKYKWFFGTSRS